MASHAADATFLAALLGGASAAEAATKAGISKRTASRRLADPAFQAALADTKREQRARAVDALGAASTQAVATLVELLDADPPLRPATRPLVRSSTSGCVCAKPRTWRRAWPPSRRS